MDPVVQPEASVVQTGTGIRYLGDWAYAYSGSIGVDDSSPGTTLLEFTSGSGIIVGFFNSIFGIEGNTNDDYLWTVYLNNQKVIAIMASSARDLDANRIDIIIPPFSQVKVTAINASTSTTNQVGSNITGRVYGTE